ncbi:MAG: MauE/DoxX family redox-associated membrane protein [Gilvibacter sp.]
MITHTYYIQGMTCEGCASSVRERLLKLPDITDVVVSLEMHQAKITSSKPLFLEDLAAVLAPKHSIQAADIMSDYHAVEASKWVQLKPLFLIFLFIGSATFLLNYKEANLNEAMYDFMGLFFVVFSFFKLLDLKGFPATFAMYDPLAKWIPAYGWVYPFLELALGVLFLMRLQLPVVLIITLVILSITTIGVLKSLVSKKKIKCACLGTALNLPMTEATLIENTIMIIMAIVMIFKTGVL